ncbi:MAG TPA: hypothetical protein VG937_29065 [Polyangiaceae bacterium]|jgi:hypothetical protein|nr:hypothetical protein [Polyangiaceae bacterium]
MKSLVRTLFGISLAAAYFVTDVPRALASLTLSGSLPGGTTPVVILQAHGQTSATGVVKLLLSAPTAGAYALNFCVGPASNPCGFSPPTSYVVNVPGGQQRLAVISAAQLASNVLVVAQGTTSAKPYTVTIE